MIRGNFVLPGVPLPCKLLPFQVLAVQLLESPPLQEMAREAGDQAGEAEVVSGAGEGAEV